MENSPKPTDPTDNSPRRPSDPWGVKKIIPSNDEMLTQAAAGAAYPPEVSVVDDSVQPEIPAGKPLADLPEPQGEPIMRLPRIRIPDEGLEEDAPKPRSARPRKPPDALPTVARDEPVTQILDTNQPVLFKQPDQPSVEQVTGHFVVTETGAGVVDNETQSTDAVTESEPPTTESAVPKGSFTPTGKHPKASDDTTRRAGFKLTDYWLSLVLTAIIVATGATILIVQQFADVLTGTAGNADVKTGISQIEDDVPGAPVTSGPRAVTDDGNPALPAYAQGQVVFSSNRAEDFDLYLLDMASGAVEQLVGLNESDERDPSWSPNGQQIAFVSGSNIFVTDQFGGSVRQITDSDAADRSPRWTVDGTGIIFSRESIDGSTFYTVAVGCGAATDETCEADITPIDIEGFNRFPQILGDNTLLYTTAQFVGRPSRIVSLNLRTLNATELAGTGTSDFFPVASPDQSQIAFVSFAEGDAGDNDIWLMARDGSNAVRLTANPANDVEPSFSPDGNWLMFASNRSSDSNFELYALDLTCVERLANAPNACEETLVPIVENLADDLAPAWGAAP